MLLHLIILLWVFILTILFQNSGLETQPYLVNENYSIYRTKRIIAFLICIIPFIVVAFRTDYVDTASYIGSFNRIPNDISKFENYIKKSGSGLFDGLVMLFKIYISQNSKVYIFTVALIQFALLSTTLRNYSENFGMSVYVFISSSMLLSWMCNGIRQFIAVCILFAATKWLLNGKWYIYFLLAILLMGINPICNAMGINNSYWWLGGIHQSVLIVILAAFIAKGKMYNWRTLFLIIVFLIVIISGGLNSVLQGAAANTDYSEDIEYISAGSGANPFRFMVSSVPTVLVIIKLKEIKQDNTPQLIHFCINMSLIASLLYLASVFTSGVFVGRLPIYCEVYNLILIPWLFNHPYKYFKRKLSILMYCLYFLYYIYLIVFAWDLSSYKISIF